LPFPRRLIATAVLAALSAAPVQVALAPSAVAAAAPPASYNAAVLADAPLFYWPLDETSGTVKDLTGRAAASTVTKAQLGASGAVGTAAVFDGSAQQVQVPYNAAMRMSGSFSAELWAKLPSSPQTSGWPTLFSRGSVLKGRYGSAMWVTSDANHTVNFKRNGYDLSTSRGLNSTSYRHLVFTWDNTAKRWTWYVDGTLDTSGVLAGLSGTDTETGPLVLGAMLNGSSPVNLGKVQIDGLALYGKALTSAQVAAHKAAAVATPPAVKRYVAGVAVGANQPWNPRRAADYQAIGKANATWIRSDLGWQYLEPIKGDWRWNTFDQVVADTKASGMKYLAILHTVPGWANGNAGDYGMPADLSLMTNYCYQTARHYLPLGVTDYEIGNEINLPHPGWNPNGATYAKSYLTPCVAGVRKAATELGIKANIVFGSLAPTEWTGGADPATFLTEAYANGAGGLFDAMAWHPYTGEYTPATSGHMNADSATLYNIMTARGDGVKKIWATEYGVPTGGPYSVSEQVQSDYVNSALDVWYAKPFAGPMFWYAGRDNGTSPDDREQHFGVLRHDGTAKLAYATLTGRLTR
jgi:polysaccharide biosynthesis protein PslG